ncbi:MAG: efflux RND transporter periplasmic adaptor subunit [Myxococcota bacterium]
MPKLSPLVFASACCTLALSCSSGVEGGDAPARPVLVSTVQVSEQASYDVTRRFNGIVRARRTSRLGFERGGRIAKVSVDEGDQVKRGQVLAELDRSALFAGRKRIEASLREAEAAVGIAELTAKRLDSLAEEQFTSRQESDEATFGLNAAIARRDSLRARLREIDVDLEKSRLVAPFSGQVAGRMVDEGTVVGAGTPVLRFLETGGKEAAIGVPSSVAAELRAGVATQVQIRSETVQATVVSRVDDVDASTRTTSLIVALPPEVNAVDGDVVSLEHGHTVESRGFWVPVTALTRGLRGLWTVYAVDETEGESTLRREEVHIIHTETERAFVRGTLETGDFIVETGLHRVVPKQRVRVQPSVAQAVETAP